MTLNRSEFERKNILERIFGTDTREPGCRIDSRSDTVASKCHKGATKNVKSNEIDIDISIDTSFKREHARDGHSLSLQILVLFCRSRSCVACCVVVRQWYDASSEAANSPTMCFMPAVSVSLNSLELIECIGHGSWVHVVGSESRTVGNKRRADGK